jgi:hypothetical protein
MYASGIADVLPDGMRVAELHHPKEIGDDYLAMWSEFVELQPKPWETEDFTRTAYLLGRLAARRRLGAGVNDRLPERCWDMSHGGALRYYANGRIRGALAELRDGNVWRHPVLADALALDPTLPDDLLALGDQLDAIMDRLDTLPQTFAHGDASPQNLLIPAADRSQRIVIDWGFGNPLPIGFDLGQLLIGLAHAGELGVSKLAEVDAAILPAYLEGLADENYDFDPDEVRFGYIGSMTVRSAFTAIPFEMLDAGAAPTMFADRLRLTRVLVDMAQSNPWIGIGSD